MSYVSASVTHIHHRRYSYPANMSSLLDLDPDLTGLIFQAVARQSRKAPWILAHVCRSWRGLALSSQRLWSDVRADHPETEGCRSRVAAQLALSRDCDVTVRFSEPPSFRLSGTENECVKDVLAVLAARSAQWTKADLSLDGTALAYLGQRVRGRLPRLRHLVLNLTEYQSAVPPAAHQPFTLAPMLSRLELLRQSTAYPAVPLGQLTRLDLFFTNDVCRLLLVHTPQLEVLRLRFAQDPGTATPLDPPAWLPRLHTLQVETTAYLDFLEPPALRTFELVRDEPIWPKEETAPWFRLLRRIPALKVATVHVQGVHDNTADWLRRSLADIPISTLILTITANSVPARRLLRALTLSKASEVIAPGVPCMEFRLFRGWQHWIDVEWHSVEERGADDERALLKMVRSRLAEDVSGRRPLRRLVVTAEYFHKHGETQQHLEDLRRHGLDVDVSAWGEGWVDEDEEALDGDDEETVCTS
ncbi:hypothetical protein C8R43DRAFT_1118555 [Mycena crocata]|nr:hypothetical protein C8R43DRAFT_1118555 [Mycena crocata]